MYTACSTLQRHSFPGAGFGFFQYNARFSALIQGFKRVIWNQMLHFKYLMAHSLSRTCGLTCKNVSVAFTVFVGYHPSVLPVQATAVFGGIWAGSLSLHLRIHPSGSFFLCIISKDWWPIIMKGASRWGLSCFWYWTLVLHLVLNLLHFPLQVLSVWCTWIITRWPPGEYSLPGSVSLSILRSFAELYM